MRAEVPLDFADDLDDFPGLHTSGSVPPWFNDSVLLHDLGNLAVSSNNPFGWSDDSLRHVVEEVFDDVREVIFWRVLGVSVDVLPDDLDDSHSDGG